MTPQEQFAQKVGELIRQSRGISGDAAARVVALLDQARTEIVGKIASVDPQSFTSFQLAQLRLSIEQAMDIFRRQATQVLDSAEEQAFTAGTATAGDPLATLGLDASTLGQVSRSALTIAQAYTADLITNLSRDAAAKINGTLQRAFLGGQQLNDIVGQVGRALDANFTGSLFDSIGERAADITLNEVLRVHSIATQARLEDLAGRHPELKKEWKHVNAARVPRATHIVADGQVVPVDEPFIVGGEDLMYPRDPNGSPENTINCHCVLAPYVGEDALAPSKEQQGLLERLGISISVAA